MTAPASPLQVLAEEHVLILRALDVLEIRLRAVAAGAPADRAVFEQMVELLRAFADRCHHGKEEDLLFPVMVEQLEYAPRSGPLAVLSRDHEAGRALLAGIADAVARIETDPAAAGALVEKGRAYLDLLRAHIQREDEKVFPTVEDLLEPADAARLAAAFAGFDAAACGGQDAAWAARALTRLDA
jgi:hemerythrin-like domain-containing protein